MQTRLVTDIERKMGDGFIRQAVQAWIAEEIEHPYKISRNPFSTLLRVLRVQATSDEAGVIEQRAKKSSEELLEERVNDLTKQLDVALKQLDESLQTQDVMLKTLTAMRADLGEASDGDDGNETETEE